MGGCVGGSTGGCVGGGGSTGGSVGGSVGGTSVGGTLVGGTEVEAGRVGCASVGITGLDSSEFESRVRGVEDRIGVGVVVGVRVNVGVAVGNVEVIVGRFDAVAVGTVAVGNGPRRALAVIANAVFVLLTLLSLSALPRIGLPNTMA
jgi:hypothetical protein